MRKQHLIKITTDDIAFVSQKIYATYRLIKKSERLTDLEKIAEIDTLVQRAIRFKLDDVVQKMGYRILEVPIKGKEPARLIYPATHQEEALVAAIKHLEALKEIKTIEV